LSNRFGNDSGEKKEGAYVHTADRCLAGVYRNGVCSVRFRFLAQYRTFPAGGNSVFRCPDGMLCLLTNHPTREIYVCRPDGCGSGRTSPLKAV